MTSQDKTDENIDRPVLILLAEDNSDHAELIQTCFRDQNLLNEVRHVRDGEMALDYLLQQGEFTDPETSPVRT
jgi:CheY-like chemotaxis protein